jgi:MFS superfamily sulfate permease-like transporter
MLLFVNSLESLLTVKAVDHLDPYKRKSDYDGDLKAVGFGNFVSGLFGGLPIISEVVRSTSNITYEAKSKWSNFFHGLFLLIAMLFFIPVIEMIPNAALAAMLIYAGYRLSAPRHFVAIWRVGKEQMAIFFTTIVVTLAFDLLLGIFSGVLVKFIFHLMHGVSLQRLIFAKVSVKREPNEAIRVNIDEAAIFSHLLLAKKVFDKLPKEKNIILDFSSCTIVDHSFLELVDYFKNEYEKIGGNVSFVGLEQLTPISKHPLATRRLIRSYQSNIK